MAIELVGIRDIQKDLVRAASNRAGLIDSFQTFQSIIKEYFSHPQLGGLRVQVMETADMHCTVVVAGKELRLCLSTSGSAGRIAQVTAVLMPTHKDLEKVQVLGSFDFQTDGTMVDVSNDGMAGSMHHRESCIGVVEYFAVKALEQPPAFN